MSTFELNDLVVCVSDYEEHNTMRIYEIEPDDFIVVRDWHSVYSEPGEIESAAYSCNLEQAIALVMEREEIERSSPWETGSSF